MTGWVADPAHRRWLEAEGDRLLEFSRASRHPAGGFAWLGVDGTPDLDRPVELWITCRMTHVFALGQLLGRPGCASLVEHGLAAIRGRFHDEVNGGWYAAVDADGPVETTKAAYPHAFVVIAASSAAAAGHPAGRSCWTRRSGCCSTGSGTTSTGWSSRSGTRASPPSTPTGASTPTCTRSRRCSRPPTSPATLRCCSVRSAS